MPPIRDPYQNPFAGYSGRTPGINTPGYTPDYSYLLGQDPGLMATRNNNSFAMAQAAAARNAAINKLKYGYSGAGNRFATLAQLDRALKEQVFQGKKALAGRGMLHSGETPWMKEQAQWQHDLGAYNASMTLEDQITAALQGYLGTAMDVANSESQGISDAASRMASNPLYQPQSGYAQFDQQLSQQYGKQVFRDLSGRYWTVDENGNTIPFTA